MNTFVPASCINPLLIVYAIINASSRDDALTMVSATAVDIVFDSAANQTCSSQNGICPPPADGWMPADGADLDRMLELMPEVQCPQSCHQCPGWELKAEPEAEWFTVQAITLMSPVLFWVFLPFIRGEGSKATLYDIFVCNARRLYAACTTCPCSAFSPLADQIIMLTRVSTPVCRFIRGGICGAESKVPQEEGELGGNLLVDGAGGDSRVSPL